QDQEDDETDPVTAPHHHVTDGLDDLTGGVGPLVAVQEDQAGGGNGKGETEERGDQKQGRENGEVQRLQRVHGDQNHHEGQGDVEGNEHVQHDGGKRDEDHENGRDHREGDKEVAIFLDGVDGCRFGHRDLKTFLFALQARSPILTDFSTNSSNLLKGPR